MCAADVDMRQDEGETVNAVWLHVEGQTPAQERRAKHLQFTSDKHSGPSVTQLPKRGQAKEAINWAKALFSGQISPAETKFDLYNICTFKSLSKIITKGYAFQMKIMILFLHYFYN